MLDIAAAGMQQQQSNDALSNNTQQQHLQIINNVDSNKKPTSKKTPATGAPKGSSPAKKLRTSKKFNANANNLMNQAAATAGGGKSIISTCAGCDRPILDQYLYTVLDRHWHQRCIQCCDCKQNLSDKCFSRDGKIYCREDFIKRYGPKCSGCHQGIYPSDLVRRAKEKIFHINCFTCCMCRKTISTGEQLYVVDENKFMCERDFNKNHECCPPTKQQDDLDDERLLDSSYLNQISNIYDSCSSSSSSVSSSNCGDYSSKPPPGVGGQVNALQYRNLNRPRGALISDNNGVKPPPAARYGANKGMPGGGLRQQQQILNAHDVKAEFQVGYVETLDSTVSSSSSLMTSQNYQKLGGDQSASKTDDCQLVLKQGPEDHQQTGAAAVDNLFGALSSSELKDCFQSAQQQPANYFNHSDQHDAKGGGINLPQPAADQPPQPPPQEFNNNSSSNQNNYSEKEENSFDDDEDFNQMDGDMDGDEEVAKSS